MQPLWKTVWMFIKKLKIELPYDLAIALLSIYPRAFKEKCRTDICIKMFIAVFITVAKNVH